MLDFSADWCISCKEMERFTFTDAKVQSRLKDVVLLQVDVTAGTPDDAALLKRFRLFGPPGILFLDRQGREIARGLTAYNASDAERIAGKRTVEIEAILGYRGRDEMIHRDDLAMTEKP